MRVDDGEDLVFVHVVEETVGGEEHEVAVPNGHVRHLSQRRGAGSCWRDQGIRGRVRRTDASCGVSKLGACASPSDALPSWKGMLNSRSCCGERKLTCQ